MLTAKRLYEILTPDQHRAAGVLVGLMLIGMVFETLGVGLVVPMIAVMSESDLGSTYPALTPWLSRLGNPSHTWLVVAAMLTLVGVYALKTMFLAFLTWWQARFVYGLQANVSQRLFAGYLRQPYSFHLQRNSAELIRNATSHASGITSVIQQSLLLLAEILVLLGISALLLTVEPFGALLVVSTLGLAGWGFNRFTHNQVLRWGKAIQHHEGLRIQHLQQGLGGAKDVKLLGRESEFLAQYWAHNSGIARVCQLQATAQAMPRLGLELLAIIGLAALVLAMIAQGRPVEALLPTLGLFAAAAFRLMPSVNRVLVAMQYARFYLPVIDTLHGELSLLDMRETPQCGPPMPFTRALTLDQVCFRHQSVEALVLRNISLSISRGASVGLIGGSGAGKSTLVDIILGLLTPVSGIVKIDGIDIQTNLRGWQDRIGYVAQSIFLTDDTLRSNVAFGLPNEQIDESAVWRAIRSAQLEQFVTELPQGLDTVVGERGIRLSGGQRQRIGIARALYHDPAVLVLDEATSSLDVDTEAGVMEAIRSLQGEKTIIIVAHRLSTVSHCDYLYRLEQGVMVEEGTVEHVLRKQPTT